MKRLFARAQIGVVRAYRRTRNARAKSRTTRVIAVAGRAELPEDLHPRRVYLLGTTTPKWALLDCPCGRGHTIELNLANPARTRWTVTANTAGQPSVHPSIDYQGQPRCHFWLKDGRIHWVPTGSAVEQPQPEERNLNMVPVVSDNVAFVGYEHATRTMRVRFRSGGVYDYYDVPAFLYEAMLLPHPWRRVGQQIRAHRYRRIAA